MSKYIAGFLLILYIVAIDSLIVWSMLWTGLMGIVVVGWVVLLILHHGGFHDELFCEGGEE